MCHNRFLGFSADRAVAVDGKCADRVGEGRRASVVDLLTCDCGDGFDQGFPVSGVGFSIFMLCASFVFSVVHKSL